MAELPSLGQHCASPDCHQLDFLPVLCVSCQLVFCKNHAAMDRHSCTRQAINTEKPIFTGEKSYKCEYQACPNKELTPIVCAACSKNFCLSHRHQVEHSCEHYQPPKEKMTETKKHVQHILETKQQETKKKPGKGHKSKAMAAKVALMKIKLNSLGNKGIPESERVYLKVALPKGSKQKCINAFVSKEWTVGKTVDTLAELGGCENRNNIQEAKKLRLFEVDSGKSMDIKASVKESIEKEIFFSGSTVILEYIDGDTDYLEHTQLYSIS